MKDEIKEILDFLKDKRGYYKTLSQDKTDKLLDCITNLQQELKEANESITWWHNRFNALQKENKRLKELCDKYEEEHNTAFKLWTMKMEQMPDYEEKIKYKSRNEKAINKIQYIIDYGFDYDGFNNVKDLKGLIDMLVDYARQSKDILQGDDK